MAMAAGLQQPMLLSWNCHRKHRRRLIPPPSHPQLLTPLCALSKQGHRFFTSLAINSTTDDQSTTNRLIRKFIASSSKSVALNAISHLLSPNTSYPRLSSLALPLYSTISKASWFNWNPKLMADVIALLYKHGRFEEVETLISEAASKLGFRDRELCTFYCNLIDSHSNHESKQGIFDSYARLKELHSYSSSVYLQKRAYESIIGGLCAINLPNEAENLMEEMKCSSLKPSIFEYKCVIYGYGKLGFFEDMKRVIGLMEDEGFGLDVVCSNMVLSSLGANKEHLEMVSWILRMKELGIPFSVRTYNSVLNSCPTIMSMVRHPKHIPTSIQELIANLSCNEALLVQELIRSAVIVDAMELNSSEMKLDLHGMHLGCAYLIMLQWFDELRLRYIAGNQVVPMEMLVVCGLGKHSTVRGESPVKGLVKEMMVRMKCPLRIDRKNVGCFVAKGRVLVDWLSNPSK